MDLSGYDGGDKLHENLAFGYKFEFSRSSANVTFKDDNTMSRNIIIVDVKDTIGRTIYSIKMNESECIKLMDCITMYMYEFDDINANCEVVISTTTNGKYPVLAFHNMDERYKCDKNYTNELMEYRGHILSIYEVDTNNQNSYIQILNIPMGETEISDFVFNLYFSGLIDLVLTPEVNDRLDLIMSRVFGDMWFTCD